MIIRPEEQVIQGSKGGDSKPHQPTEAPDSRASIDYIKILLGLGEGEWEGGITGQDVYLNDTPIVAADGSTNIPNVTWEFRPGTIDQTYIQGIPSVDNEIGVNVEVRNANFYSYTATNSELSALRVRIQFDALYQYRENGDMVGAPLDYIIELQTGPSQWRTVVEGHLNDKFTTKYSRTHRIDLPPMTGTGWTIRVRKTSPDAANTRAANTMRVAAVAEVIDAKLVYPNTALLFVQFDASLYSGTPKISVNAKGRKVRVPSNYSPEARTYAGTWDGTFKLAWTDNPVWHWYDIVLNRRFGLGRRVDATMVNKWTLYRISQYADQMVSDGKGGLQPRFTCNIYIQRRQDAFRVLADMASIFRGMSYWDGATVSLDADMPADVVYTFSPSNIVGQFETVSSARKDRYNLTVVKWDNPDNGYATQSRPVNNTKSQVRYGVWQTELTAVGCTVEAEAVRRGEWTNLTAFYETETINFISGVEGRNLRPGSIIAIADPDLAGKPMGGRIVAAAGRTITLDRTPDVVAGDTLRLNLPSGVSQERSIASVNGNALTVVASFTEAPVAQAQWSVERAELVTQKYRILTNDEDEGGKRKITAVQHNPSKYAAVDSGARVETPPVTSVPVTSMGAPANINITQNVFTDQGVSVTTLTAGWDQVPNAVKYEVQWKRDDGAWVNVGIVTANSVDVTTVYAGLYLVRVRSISAMDVYSIWGFSPATTLLGKTEPPPKLARLIATQQVFGIRLDWSFPDGASDTAFTELQYSRTNDGQGITPLTLAAYPTNRYTMDGLAAGVAFFFRGRLQDRSGNVGAWTNWVRGTSSSDADVILDYLRDKITKSQLGRDLLDEIDKIPGLADQIDRIKNTLDYDPAVANTTGDIVRKDGKLWQAVKDVPANADGSNGPPNATYWLNVGDLLQTANAMAGRLNTVENTLTDVKATVKTSEQLVASFTTEYTGDDDGYTGDTTNYAGTVSIQSVVADALTAEALRTTTLEARVNTNYASLLEEVTARTTAISALAARTTTLEASIGEGVDALRAQVNTTAKTVATLDGKVNASQVTQVAVTANGQRYAAGFAIGVDYSGGQVSSQFAVIANRFAVLNGTDQATASLPFVIENGQVFMNDAFIKQATINNLLVGSYIRSRDFTDDGKLPLLRLEMDTGRMVAVNRANSNSYITYDNNAVSVVVNGVLRVRMGSW